LAEIVYVLTNEAMEGLVKIGRTTTGVEQRIKELDNTSLPLPFQCFYAGEVENSSFVENKIHKIFIDKRVRSNREFFRVDPNQVREAIQLAEIKDVTPKSDVVVDPSDIQALKVASGISDRRSRLSFQDLMIPTGSMLRFAKDENVICTIAGHGKVEFEGQIMSLSAAALIAVRRLGYNWSAVSGSDYWKFEDETLVARRLRFEDENLM
jgi:hypothetical protein